MLTEEEFKNLDIVFAMARQSCVNNEEQLIGVINFKKLLYDKLKPKVEEAKEEVITAN